MSSVAPAGTRAGLAIGVDIGGSKVGAGLVDVDGRVHRRAARLTPDRSTEPELVEDLVLEVVTELLDAAPGPAASHGTPPARERVGAVGVGAAGFVSADRSTVVFAPHLAWRNEPLQERLERRLGLPVLIDNDANAAGWAEWRFGAARGESHLMMVTLGTGIGGAILVDGRVQRGRFGIAGEYGHMQVVPDGHRCECGNRGCWEQYASGNALVREARSLIAAGSPLAQGLSAAVAGRSEDLTGPVVTATAQQGDPTARELFADVGAWLGTGLANLAAAFDPGMFVIGGGVSTAGDLLLQPATEAFRRHLAGRGHRPEARIALAELGNDAGLVGAADLARSAAAPDPSEDQS